MGPFQGLKDSAISRGMPKPKPHEFKLRVSPQLWDVIEQIRGKKSLNRQINDWLWAMANPDDADKLAAALRPILKTMSETDRSAFVDHAMGAIKALSAPKPKVRKRRVKPVLWIRHSFPLRLLPPPQGGPRTGQDAFNHGIAGVPFTST